MDKKILIALRGDEVAPRFDLATEALMVTLTDQGEIVDRKSLLLAHASGDDLCDLALGRDASGVVCGAIEEEYYHYLRWKRVDVLDSVAGPVEDVLRALAGGTLRAGDVLFPREG
ncbi:NifB/NifX family molybdenum-iron cluster-binding protein [Desulfovibrio aminophilus]|uniref:NifB/NifX family molybdenum-iron cluster-binding protein n=1 Tax=Desulfovibrio aminophilus TaxID=81425 RepID=UPI00339B8FD8